MGLNCRLESLVQDSKCQCAREICSVTVTVTDSDPYNSVGMHVSMCLSRVMCNFLRVSSHGDQKTVTGRLESEFSASGIYIYIYIYAYIPIYIHIIYIYTYTYNDDKQISLANSRLGSPFTGDDDRIMDLTRKGSVQCLVTVSRHCVTSLCLVTTQRIDTRWS